MACFCYISGTWIPLEIADAILSHILDIWVVLPAFVNMEVNRLRSRPISNGMEELKGEKCGVFGVYGKGLSVARLTFFGLYSLQHRGQESSGITTSDGSQLYSHVGMGLVSQA